MVSRRSDRRQSVLLSVECLEDRTVPSFLPGVDYTVGMNPRAVTPADVNADGTIDLVVANIDFEATGNGSVSVLPGNGDGSFGTALSIAVGEQPHFTEVTDFNGDGRLDLIVTNSQSGTIGLLPGNGDFSFGEAVNLTADGVWPHRMALRDFNGDGQPDLAVLNTFSNSVSLFLGGSGTFTLAATQLLSADPALAAVGIQAGDFNADGALDLAVANFYFEAGGQGAVHILLGNGDGTFQAAGSYATGGDAWSVTTGDFNSDGKLDLAVTHATAGVHVLLGNGDGTFQSPVTFLTGEGAVDVQVTDLDSDGKLDLVTANIGGSVSVLYGNGDGTFQVPQNYPAGAWAFYVAVADLNADGYLDLAVANLATNTVTILRNAGPLPQVASIVVNDGPDQRSLVTSLTITFNTVVTLGSDALVLVREGVGPVGLNITTSQEAGQTVVFITFLGEEIIGNSLADGGYTLTIRSDRIQDAAGRALDGDFDGVPGADHLAQFHRLYGDTDGDADVDADDANLFLSAYGASAGDPNYVWFLDFEGDGFIGPSDLSAFMERHG